METGEGAGAEPASGVPRTPLWHQRVPGLIRTSSLQILFGLRICALLTMAGLLFGAAFADWADDPDSLNAFLDEGWVRSLVDGRGWIFMLGALLVYVGRLGLALRSRRLQRNLQWLVPAELAAVAILGGVTALGLSWLSVVYLPCALHARC
ncbi:MAG: hypothetical protein OXE02_02345 [Chloroflexi bacterium]|nr:hypothetical protein [Chloroflexota bacterium]